MQKQTSYFDFNKWKKWQNNLGRINKELLSLDRGRRVFDKIHGIIEKNANIHKFHQHLFFDWMIHNYCVRLGMGIRRLVDARSNQLNIYKLLLDIKDNTGLVTIENYVISFFPHDKNFFLDKHKKSYHVSHLEKVALRAFKEAFGRPRKKLLVRDVSTDRIKIESIAKARIENFVDKNWAHLDKKRVAAPTIQEAHQCLDTLIDIYNRYSLLLCRQKFSPPSDNILFTRWENLFRISWVQ